MIFDLLRAAKANALSRAKSQGVCPTNILNKADVSLFFQE